MSRISTILIGYFLIFLLIIIPSLYGYKLYTSQHYSMILFVLLFVSMVTLHSLFNGKLQAHNLRQTSFYIFIFFSIGFFVLCIGQLIPIDMSLIKKISINTYKLYSYKFFSDEVSYAHLSINPYLTFNTLILWLVLFSLLCSISFFKAKYLYGNEVYSYFKFYHKIIIGIFSLGLFQAFYGLVEMLSGHEYIFLLPKQFSRGFVTGTFVNRNNFAALMEMIIPLSVGYLMSTTIDRPFSGIRDHFRELISPESRTPKNIILSLGIIIMILALILSGSRTGIISTFISYIAIAGFIGFKNKRGWKTLLSIIVLSLLWSVWYGIDVVLARFQNIEHGLLSRIEIWKDTINIIKDFPLLGTGLGTFSIIYPKYKSIIDNLTHHHAESDVLQVISEVGILGFLLILLAMYFLVRFIFLARINKSDRLNYIAIGAISGLLNVIVHSFFEKTLLQPAIAFIFIVILGLIVNIARLSYGMEKVSGNK